MAFDAFLKIQGIAGDSTDKLHKGEIELLSFSWGVTNTGSAGTGGGPGTAQVQDFHFTMLTSKASPNLMLACATGRHLPSAQLTCRKAGIEFLKVRLSDVLVSSYELGGETSGDFPDDQIGVRFVKMDMLFTVARTGETVETTFDARGVKT